MRLGWAAVGLACNGGCGPIDERCDSQSTQRTERLAASQSTRCSGARQCAPQTVTRAPKGGRACRGRSFTARSRPFDRTVTCHLRISPRFRPARPSPRSNMRRPRTSKHVRPFKAPCARSAPPRCSIECPRAISNTPAAASRPRQAAIRFLGKAVHRWNDGV